VLVVEQAELYVSEKGEEKVIELIVVNPFHRKYNIRKANCSGAYGTSLKAHSWKS
jgi:hypothetical protein